MFPLFALQSQVIGQIVSLKHCYILCIDIRYQENNSIETEMKGRLGQLRRIGSCQPTQYFVVVVLVKSGAKRIASLHLRGQCVSFIQILCRVKRIFSVFVVQFDFYTNQV